MSRHASSKPSTPEDRERTDVEGIEIELVGSEGEHPTLGEAERAAMIKGHAAKDGRVRLALEGRNVSIDVTEFRPLTEEIDLPTGSSVAAKKRATEVNVGVATARKLWREIDRRLGGAAEIPTTASP